MRNDNSLVGAAGVHYAAYHLARNGLVALPTVRNTPGIDLIVMTPDGQKHANIQVKTSHLSRTRYWPICSAEKFEKLPFGKNDYYLLLRWRRDDDPSSARAEAAVSEVDGFLLTAREAEKELEASRKDRERKGKHWNYPLIIAVDKDRGMEQSPEYKHRDWQKDRERWRKRWREFSESSL